MVAKVCARGSVGIGRGGLDRTSVPVWAGLHPIVAALAAAYRYPMKAKTFLSAQRVGLILGAALLPLLMGCVAETHQRRERVYVPSVAVQTVVVLEDDYVYYPGYEVYYSNTRRQYVYRDGRSWVTRPAPPRVAIEVLLASPSVRVDFRDAPERHHADMVRRYPRNWRGSEHRHEVRNDERKDDRKDDRKDERKGDRDDDNRKRD